jgi:hypothetical protein
MRYALDLIHADRFVSLLPRSFQSIAQRWLLLLRLLHHVHRDLRGRHYRDSDHLEGNLQGPQDQRQVCYAACRRLQHSWPYPVRSLMSQSIIKLNSSFLPQENLYPAPCSPHQTLDLVLALKMDFQLEAWAQEWERKVQAE